MQNKTLAIISKFLFYIMLFTPITLFAESTFVYRWIDPVSGKVEYGAEPPENGVYEMVHIEHGPAPDPVLEKRFDTMNAEVDRYIQERKLQRQAKLQQAAEESIRTLDCQKAKDWLAKLESRPGPHILVVSPDGSGRRMTEEERQAKMAATQERINQLCTKVYLQRH